MSDATTVEDAETQVITQGDSLLCCEHLTPIDQSIGPAALPRVLRFDTPPPPTPPPLYRNYANLDTEGLPINLTSSFTTALQLLRMRARAADDEDAETISVPSSDDDSKSTDSDSDSDVTWDRNAHRANLELSRPITDPNISWDDRMRGLDEYRSRSPIIHLMHEPEPDCE